jgi:hypothetical protein
LKARDDIREWRQRCAIKRRRVWLTQATASEPPDPEDLIIIVGPKESA